MSPARGEGWEPSGPYRRVAAAAVAAALLISVALAAAELYVGGGNWGFPLDDSWIHLAFARSLAEGSGLTFNAGQFAAASTAPLWTALLSLGFLLPGGPLLWSKLLGVALHGLAVWGVVRLASRLGLSPASALLAGGLAGTAGWLVWASLSGLEVPLFLALSMWGMAWHVEERHHPQAVPRSLVILAASALARPEGLLLWSLALLDRALTVQREADGSARWRLGAASEWRRLAAGGAAVALLVAPVALFHTVVGGSPFPATYLAKASSHHSVIPQASHLFTMLGVFFRPFPLLVLLAGAGAVELIRRLGTDRDHGLLPLFWLIALPLGYGALSPAGGSVLIGNFGRYLFPVIPVFVVVGGLGLEGLLRSLPAGRTVRVLAVAALVLWPAGAGTLFASGRFLQSVGNVEQGDVRAAKWLAETLPDDAVVAVNDIGAMKYYLPEHRLLDLAGITNPEIVDYRREALAAGRALDEANRRFLDETRPDYLAVFPAWFPDLVVEGSGYPVLHRFAIPDNIALGDDSIAVLATPWTRSPLRPTQGDVR